MEELAPAKERRASDKLVEEVRILTSNAAKDFQAIADKALSELEQAIKDQDTLGQIHRQHVDALFDRVDQRMEQIATASEKALQQMAESNRELISRIEQLIGLNSQRFDEAIGHQSQRVGALEKRVGMIERDTGDELEALKGRVSKLEKAPIEAAAGKWRRAVDKILWGVFGLFVAALILEGKKVLEFFVKLFGGE